MTIQRHHVNARMSQSVSSNGTVYLAGLFSREDAGGTVAEQTTDILNRIEELLIESGSTKANMLTAMIWLKDISTFDEFNAVWDHWVPEGAAPARACVETKFPLDRIKVEIQITARSM